MLALASCAPGSSGKSSSTSTADAYTVVDAQFVIDNADSKPLVDVRTAQEYNAGHIPKAVNIEYSEVMSKDATQAAAMVDEYRAAGIGADSDVIIYCRTGKRVKAVAEILWNAGYSNIYLYEGSWTDWTVDPGRPVE